MMEGSGGLARGLKAESGRYKGDGMEGVVWEARERGSGKGYEEQLNHRPSGLE